MDDAVAHFRTCSEADDLAALSTVLADDVELVSPLSGRLVFRGRADVALLLGAVYGSVSDLRWTEEVGDGAHRVVLGRCAVGPLRMTDAMALDLAADGKIRRIRPHLRPWLAVTVFALLIGSKLARHPGVLVRALRSAS